MEEMIAEIKQKQAEIKRLQKELQDKSSEIFLSSFKNLFEETPKLKSFAWSQYTPYFNDGETCTFSANVDYIYINGICVDDSDWISEKTITNYGTWNRETKKFEGRTEVSNLNYDSELVKANDEIREFLYNFDEDFFMAQFGDHAKVTVTEEGVSVDEYEHD